jgi:TPP-dependent pyruvate/acetoin dehydrogenase alpha subunit
MASSRKSSQRPRNKGSARKLAAAAWQRKASAKATTTSRTAKSKAAKSGVARAGARVATLSDTRLLEFYKRMVRIRMVEEAIVRHYPEAEMRCPVHLSIGQEPAAVGVCGALAPTDKIYTTHRCHAHYLAKGGDLKRMLAEIYGKAAGCVGGRGGSMHLMDGERGVVASVPIVGSSIPLAVGSALADSRLGKDTVSVAFVGDASIEEGVFHESANFAALHKLPVIFACENNLYSVYTPLRLRQPARPLTELARAHGIPALHGDGNDVAEVHALTSEAVRRARKGGGPTFLLFDTYRWREHCGPNFDNHIGYRTEAEFETWKKRDGIKALHRSLTKKKLLSVEADAALEADIAAEIDEAVAFARQAPLPTPSDAAKYVYA